MTINRLVLKAKAFRDTCGQDLVEYALMAGFVALAAGATMPGLEISVDRIFDLVRNVMKVASTQGD
jgi:pilus assembly protein Flp/PilA